MRRIIFAVAALVTAGCERYIDLSAVGPERLLVINGNLVSGDTLHTVYLSWSMFNEVKPVEEAHLECYVNGVLADSSDDVREPKRFSSDVGEVRFKAEFKAGDEVRVRVTAGECEAESVSVVPAAPSITAVDTSGFNAYTDDGDEVDYYMSRVALRDVPGEKNYYRMTMQIVSDFYASKVNPDYDGCKDGQFLCTVSNEIKFDNTYENLLHRKINIGMDGDSPSYDGDNYYSNKFNIFTDQTFSDGEYVLKIAFPKGGLYNYYPNGWSSDKFTPVQCRRIRFRVLSMSRSSYTYMNDYTFDLSDQSDWTVIGDIPYPSNVKGGTGMVSVMTPADFEINLDKISY